MYLIFNVYKRDQYHNMNYDLSYLFLKYQLDTQNSNI